MARKGGPRHRSPSPSSRVEGCRGPSSTGSGATSLPSGRYRLTVGGEHGTVGAFHLQVFLAGDVNGDRRIDMADGTLIRSIFGSSAGNGRYMAKADANRDGLVTSFDYALWRQDLGETTGLNPLDLVAAASPEPVPLPDGK